MCVTSPQKQARVYFDAINYFGYQPAVFMLIAKSHEISLR